MSERTRQIINKLRQGDASVLPADLLPADLWPDAVPGQDDPESDSTRGPESTGPHAARPTNPFRSFQQFWNSYDRPADDVASESSDRSSLNESWQRDWFASAGSCMDAYLSSPFFLRTMKQHIDTLIRSRRASDEAGRPCVDDNSGQSQSARFREAAATPHDVVLESRTFRLLRYRGEHPIGLVEPILICFALVNRPYILDLQIDRSVVRHLLARGFEVYLIDWIAPTRAERSLRLRDYVCVFLKQAADWVCGQSGSASINLLGYCMGGTMSTLFAALNQRQVRNLVLLATPIDFGGETGILNVWAKEEYFDVDAFIDAYGNCPGWFLQSCFQLMKPVQNFAEKYINLCEKLEDDAFLENFLAIERWANDNVPVAGETFREYVKWLYWENRLVNGNMRLDNLPVRLENIVCPLLLLTADGDYLVPPASTLAIRNHVQSAEVTCQSVEAGHIGLAVSSKAHRSLWPEAANWIAEHSTIRKVERNSPHSPTGTE